MSCPLASRCQLWVTRPEVLLLPRHGAGDPLPSPTLSQGELCQAYPPLFCDGLRLVVVLSDPSQSFTTRGTEAADTQGIMASCIQLSQGLGTLSLASSWPIGVCVQDSRESQNYQAVSCILVLAHPSPTGWKSHVPTQLVFHGHLLREIFPDLHPITLNLSSSNGPILFCISMKACTQFAL